MNKGRAIPAADALKDCECTSNSSLLIIPRPEKVITRFRRWNQCNCNRQGKWRTEKGENRAIEAKRTPAASLNSAVTFCTHQIGQVDCTLRGPTEQTQLAASDPPDRFDLTPTGISRTLIRGTVISARFSKAPNPNKSLYHRTPVGAKLDSQT